MEHLFLMLGFEPKISAGERQGSNPTGGMDICLL